MKNKPKRAKERKQDTFVEGRDRAFTDVARMVDDGLAGGQVTRDNGRVGEVTLDKSEQLTDADEHSFQLSYESDGMMGEQSQEEQKRLHRHERKGNDDLFFNTTQNSE